ncbi:MAG: DNA alkylation repair protein [Anaerolineae bacterium]|nr:DNA alkylation repair protein [Anaerolineae bacterium]
MDRCDAIVQQLRAQANPDNVAGMARFGITGGEVLGVSVATLRGIARDVRCDHTLALALWDTGIHEARILASIIDDPKQVTPAQMDAWAADFDSWDVCDQCCINLFRRVPWAHDRAREWCVRPETFVRRAGFSLIATLAIHDRKASDEQMAMFLPLIREAATDERNFVRKAVNWALRQIGKRSPALHTQAIQAAVEIQQIDSKAAHWIAADALRELRGVAVLRRLGLED